MVFLRSCAVKTRNYREVKVGQVNNDAPGVLLASGFKVNVLMFASQSTKCASALFNAAAPQPYCLGLFVCRVVLGVTLDLPVIITGRAVITTRGRFRCQGKH